eukprot:7902839-Alexandrium_andersonii.AAC.1
MRLRDPALASPAIRPVRTPPWVLGSGVVGPLRAINLVPACGPFSRASVDSLLLRRGPITP